MNKKKRNAKHLRHPFHLAYLNLLPVLVVAAILIWGLSLQKAKYDLKRIGMYLRGVENPYETAGVRYHLVRRYDTIESLASEFGVSIDTILWANELPYGIKQDMIILIPPVTGVIHSVVYGDTIDSIARTYGVREDDITSYPGNVFTKDKAFPMRTGQIIVVPGGRKDFEPLSY